MGNSYLAKKGVSLVTVLIFMMIATIAGTATYKWISSTGLTSADRMAMSEAKEASHAGLESVRAWMTYHANDVGAIIRQYYDGEKKPVALTNVVRSMNSSKQVFKVWLTGVEASGSSYKFTIVSNGIARGNAKYSETSVLNVRGLYKVKEPAAIVQKPVTYHQSYFGGSMRGAGNHTNSSMIINGNWSGNPTGVTGDFVITGNAKLSGNNIQIGRHACIGNNLELENEGFSGQDLYVKGNAPKLSLSLSGNAVFDGNVGSTTAGNGFFVEGDVTLRGTYTTEQTKTTEIKGNLCLDKNAKLNIPNLQRDFNVRKNVKAHEQNTSIFQNKLNDNTTNHTILGGSGYSIYLPTMRTCNSEWIHGCDNRWMHQNYTFFRSGANPVSAPTPSMKCNTYIVSYCDSILGPKKSRQGCDNTNYKIDDMITTAYSSFNQLVDKVACAKYVSNTDNFDMKNLNSCYQKTLATPKLMYHGYLVVGVHGSGDNSIFKSPKGQLNGNFIFVSENKINMLKLPPTTDNSNVFFYMAKGAKMVNTTSDNNRYKYNYFVYSKGNIDELQHSGASKTWNGSFYMTAQSCSKIDYINTSGIQMRFNETLMQNLIDSTVLCGFDEGGACGSLVGDIQEPINHEGEEMNADAGYDSYYVATAPQLSITLESQRRNKEILYDNLTSKQYTTVKPSIIILPRIIYLSDTPKGKLMNYFNVINLNGAKETFSPSNSKCTPTLKADETLSPNGRPLSSPLYMCEYTSKNKYGTIPYWVVVDAQAAQKSAISFLTTSSRLYGGSSVTVKMIADDNQADPVTAWVRVTEIPNGWTLSTPGNKAALEGTQDNGSRIYAVTLLPGQETPVFQINAENSAENSQINFTIISISENARIGDILSHSVYLDGSAIVKREDIPSIGFCDGNKHKTINGVNCTDVVSRPDCEGQLVSIAAGEWVHPKCIDPSTQNPNNQWTCGLGNTEEVRLEPKTVSPYCDVFIPDSSIETLVDGQTYTLYASYKAKLFNLKVFLNGAKGSSVNVSYSKQIIDENTPSSAIETKTCTVGDTCRFQIYAGHHIKLSSKKDAEGEKRKYWQFMRSDGTVDSTLHSEIVKFPLKHDTLIVAEYSEIENHCFYTDFKDVKIWCNNNVDKNCIDKCSGSGKHSSCETNGGGDYPTSQWLIPRTNDGQKYSKPEIQSDFIYYSAGKNPNSGNSTITYLLNRTQAGGHGTLTSRFKACYRDKNGNGNYTALNSGFMMRSTDNASRYAIVQIYGRRSQTTNIGKDVMEVRVCEGEGTGIKNENGNNKCEKATLPGITINPGDFASIVFNTDIEVFGDSATVKVSYKKDGAWVRSSVNVKLPVGANIDEYVGLSMADDCFKVMNLGWLSDDWDAENCFDVPIVGCSFAANYLGGILPLDEDVKPWVGTSSWFNDPNNPDKLRPGCSIIYHYNGCDLASGYGTGTCERWIDGITHCGSCSADSDGPYYVSGMFANTIQSSKNDKYKFTYAGLHGTSKICDYNGTTIYGAVRDASVVIDCTNPGGNGRTYEASCGRFVVGSISECSQGSSFSIDNCDNASSCVATVDGGIANLRSSTIMGEIKGLPEDQSAIISMILTDANGLKSQEFRISSNGSFSREVNLMSDMQEFDPERVVSVEFTSTNSFTIASLMSDCPNSVGIHGCTAELEGDRFVITSNVVNAGGATCKVSDATNTFKTDEKDCPADGRFHIPAVDLQKNINISGGSRSFTFTITTKSKDSGEEATCTTSALTVDASELTCDLSSTAPINPGENLPSLNYKVTNCPPSGCTIDARIGSEAPVKLLYQGNGQVNSWSPNINTTPGNYRYTLTYAGLSCTADITVVTGANGSRADNCAIDEVNKRFTADLNLAVGSTNNLKLWYLDKLGNTVGSTKSASPSTTRFNEPLPAITEAGDYIIVLSINGEEACSVQYTYTEEEPAEEAQCYIEGGRFKTRNKNTTGNTLYGVALNRNTDGATYGDGVGSTSWPDGGYIDMDAYVPTTPGTYTYNLWYSGNVLCSVTYEVKDETEENP